MQNKQQAVAWIQPDEPELFVDFYELSMLDAYVNEGMNETAVFSLYVRQLPPDRNFLIACGLDTVLDYLQNLRFGDTAIDHLRCLGKFSDRLIETLRHFRFTGKVNAVAEGTPVFANEPVLEVIAPLPQAQLIETFLMNQIHIQTVLASKAQRVVTAAGGRTVVDFGCRRMHGIDAAMKGARAFYIGGVSATSNILAGKHYNIPVTGTMAHSYIQAHQDEAASFRAFTDLYPDTVLLIDTYDTLKGVERVVGLAKELGDRFQVKAVRLDSGDLLSLSREVRRVLDNAGLGRVGIFASGGLDEYKVSELISSGAPINGFGVGTYMGVSNDAPVLDIVYKLSEYAGKGRLKLSSGKPVLPGSKQIFRMEQDGVDICDKIASADENLSGRKLLATVMNEGRRLPNSVVDIDTIKQYSQAQIERLPAKIRDITAPDTPYPVVVSENLLQYQRRVKEAFCS